MPAGYYLKTNRTYETTEYAEKISLVLKKNLLGSLYMKFDNFSVPSVAIF